MPFAIFPAKLEAVVLFAMLYAFRAEAMPLAFIVADYDRQRDTQIVAERHFPAISVTEVLEDNLLRIDLLLLLTVVMT